MAEQVFLINLSRSYRGRAVKALVDQIQAWNGQILLVTDGGYSLVARFDDSHRESVQSRPEVVLIGGVQVQPRRVRRIRVDAMGNRVTSQP